MKNHDPQKTLSEQLAMPFAVFIFIVILWGMTAAAQAQSFYPNRSHVSLQRAGQTIKTQTIGQKVRNKIKYNKKRHHSIKFAYRNMRQRSRAGQI